MKEKNPDTITAVATPKGEGAIALIRISGTASLSILNQVFRPAGKTAQLSHRAIVHGYIYEDEEVLDEVLVSFFQSPNSYTGEDLIEISCHGGIFISERILNHLIKMGARPALPGEFTQRAYLNGKMDLAQAEAVADLIQSKTETARRVAMYQLEGSLSKNIQSLKDQLHQVCYLLELELDFGEEDVELASRNDLSNLLNTIQEALAKLLKSYQRGRVCREGISLAIIGRPNVGKSSLLNAILEKERAIVTDVPGTTRDVVEDVLDIEGVLFKVLDTAGIRHTNDPVEKEGVKRAKYAAEKANIVLLVLDSSEPLQKEDDQLIRWIMDKGKDVYIVLNKSDLKMKIDKDKFPFKEKTFPLISASALNSEGIEALIDLLKTQAIGGQFPHEGEIILTRARHKEIIETAIHHIQQARESLESGLSQEFLALDIRAAMDALSDIAGATTTDDILNNIFTSFCIGK